MRVVSLLLAVSACGSGGGATDDGPRSDGVRGGGGALGSDGSTAMAGAPAVCGGGVRQRGEECDDHNTQSGDGGDSTCHVEPYSGAPQSAIDALHAMNALRAAADVPGAHLDSHCVQSSQAHANYYGTNFAAYTGPSAI